MCGIVAAVAKRNIIPALLQGLARLEYRGYDSCGLAWHTGDAITRARSTQRVAELCTQVETLSSFTGIAHTRWATHGAPLVHNAHPLVSCGKAAEGGAPPALAIVHNGIIENFEPLRQELIGQGYAFDSQTDTEVIAHLIDREYQSLRNGQASDSALLMPAVQAAVAQLRGAFAVAVVHRDAPDCVVGGRVGSPLVIGLAASSEHEYFFASDAIALTGESHQIIYLEEGDVAEIRLKGYRIVDAQGHAVERAVQTVEVKNAGAELGPYQHFMQKEMFEQPRAVADTLEGVARIVPELFGTKAAAQLQAIDRILILACGSSYLSGLCAKHWIEAWAQIPTDVEVASEYRYRQSVASPTTLVLTISQSGETADTLAALRHAKGLGMSHTFTICNVASSAMVRESAMAYITRAGAEVGVASSKAFTTQLVSLYLLSLVLAKMRGRLNEAAEKTELQALRHLPSALQAALALEPQTIAWAQEFARCENALFLGRGLHYPIALEGALKLKEISYIHAEGYPAGELKHGPLALVTDAMPVLAVAPNNALLDKLKGNLQEVRARGGQLYVLTDSDTAIESSGDQSKGIRVIRLPEHASALSPVMHTIPLQLLAYHTALLRGCDVDKPRNLAKSVTVE